MSLMILSGEDSRESYLVNFEQYQKINVSYRHHYLLTSHSSILGGWSSEPVGRELHIPRCIVFNNNYFCEETEYTKLEKAKAATGEGSTYLSFVVVSSDVTWCRTSLISDIKTFVEKESNCLETGIRRSEDHENTWCQGKSTLPALATRHTGAWPASRLD